jgi:hypothetical protein
MWLRLMYMIIDFIPPTYLPTLIDHIYDLIKVVFIFMLSAS